MAKKRILIVGAGSRGTLYADCLQTYSDSVEVVGVAEPREAWRARVAAQHAIAPNKTFLDWSEPLAHERFADAVIIATPDHLHAEPAIGYARQGYHILLEKPMAPTADECRQIAEAVRESGIMLAVCHVLRYAPYTRKLKTILESGVIGRPISIQHLEPVGYWHQAHSFVRGNWRNESESSFMLLAKSCHDLDWLAHVMEAKPVRVSSFGSLSHFRPENAPEGAADRCLQCSHQDTCPYSAPKIYFRLLDKGTHGWPLDVLTHEVNRENIERAMAEGPYGRCVYRCDNDVVDHQVVNLEFDSGQTAVFTMTAFTKPNQHRQTKIFGTLGQITCDCRTIEVFDFLTETAVKHEVSTSSGASGHAGGDAALVESFVRALVEDDPTLLLSGIEISLATHFSVFAAEKSRREGRLVDIDALPS